MAAYGPTDGSLASLDQRAASNDQYLQHLWRHAQGPTAPAAAPAAAESGRPGYHTIPRSYAERTRGASPSCDPSGSGMDLTIESIDPENRFRLTIPAHRLTPANMEKVRDTIRNDPKLSQLPPDMRSQAAMVLLARLPEEKPAMEPHPSWTPWVSDPAPHPERNPPPPARAAPAPTPPSPVPVWPGPPPFTAAPPSYQAAPPSYQAAPPDPEPAYVPVHVRLSPDQDDQITVHYREVFIAPDDRGRPSFLVLVWHPDDERRSLMYRPGMYRPFQVMVPALGRQVLRVEYHGQTIQRPRERLQVWLIHEIQELSDGP